MEPSDDKLCWISTPEPLEVSTAQASIPTVREGLRSPNTPVGGLPQPYGRYILLDRLGQGGMAEVFRALAVGPAMFRRQVVVKRILPHLSEDPRFIRMFIDEATVCGYLQHPNVIQVHEFGREGGRFFLAMEYVHGITMHRLVGRLSRNRQVLPPNVVAEIGRQVCLGLDYAHKLTGPDGKPLNIVHRDISPSNIMVSFSGVVKVVDFGIARMVSADRLSEVTQLGQFKGKSAYLAPEQCRAGNIDGRSDVFSLGIVMHEALTGQRLFRHEDPASALLLVLTSKIPRPSEVNRAVLPTLDRIVMRALEREPEQRYANAGAMAEDLDQYLVAQRFSSQALPRFLAKICQDVLAEPSLPTDAEIQAALESAHEPTGHGAKNGTGESTPAGRRRTKLRTLVAVGLVGLAIGLGFRAVVPLFDPKPDPVVAVEPASATRAVASASTDPVPARPRKVVLALTSQPSGAQVERVSDNHVLGTTPLVLELDQGLPVQLRIASPGHVPRTLDFDAAADRAVQVDLVGSGPAKHIGKGSPPHRNRKPPREAEEQGKVEDGLVNPFKE